MDLLALFPPWPIFLTFLAACLALNLTPGADMTFVIARAVGQGRPAGLVSALGIATGSLIHTLLAAFGISALLAASETAFLVLKYAGAAYLLYLAVRMILDKSSLDLSAEGGGQSLTRIWLQATLVNLLNPKVALFILAFLPQFIDPARGSTILQIILLGSVVNLLGTSINVMVALAAGSAGSFVRRSQGTQRALRILSGTLIGYLAVRLALGERT